MKLKKKAMQIIRYIYEAILVISVGNIIYNSLDISSKSKEIFPLERYHAVAASVGDVLWRHLKTFKE